MTKAERLHLSRVADLGCVLCERLGMVGTPAEIHHLRHGMGMGQRNSNFNVIPLCPEHHRGNTGFHGLGRRAFERTYNVTEMQLLDRTYQLLGTRNPEVAGHNKGSQKNNQASVSADLGLHSHLS